MRSVRTVTVLALASLGGSLLSGAEINLIGNPSFETPVISPSVTQPLMYLGGSSWQVVTGLENWGIGYPAYGVELQRNNLYNAPSNSLSGNNAWDGQQWAELDLLIQLSNGSGNPQIFQDISTIQGATYILSFYYAVRPQWGNQQLGVFWGPTSGATLPGLVETTSFGTAGNELTWVKYEFNLVATSTSMRIGFGSLSNNSFSAGGVAQAGGNLLDLVTLRVDPASIGAPGDPSTTGPTTTGPTTSGPTTSGPTTSGPTTSGPTTSGPTTSGPTTSGPTTSGPTTSGPTTGPDPVVPEPSTYLMLAAGLAAVAIRRRRA